MASTRTPEQIKAATEKAKATKLANAAKKTAGATKPAASKAAVKSGAKVAGGAITDPAPATVKKVLTQEDLDLQPNLVAEGYKVGDEVEVEDENAGDPGIAAAADNKIDEPEADATSVDIVKGNQYIRTYSQEVHGDDFHSLAESYIASPANSDISGEAQIVNSDGIKVVVVNYRQLDKKSGVSTDTARSFSLERNGEEFKNQAIAFKNEVNGSAVIGQ